jgi:hypothetical protein
MPNVYKALCANPPQVPDLIGINQAPGKIIMRQVPVQVHERTMDNLFRYFCAYFHTPGNWTWDGSPGTPDPADILDGDKRRGQCLALARAFRTLATTPWPHGIGLLPASVGEPRLLGFYDGRYHKGFVSTHPPAGILALRGNVFDAANPNLTNCGRVHYSWQDHKVVPYNGRFYDPSYAKIWNTLSAMATYHIINDDYTFNKNIYVVADDSSGSRCYFRLLTLEQCNLVQPQVSYGAAMQGPYFGDLPNGQQLATITTKTK